MPCLTNPYLNCAGSGPTNVIPNRIRPSLDQTIYRTGDLGYHYSIGTYDYNDPAGIVQELDPAAGADYYYRLKHDNAFGTRYRFTDDMGVEAPNGMLLFPNDKTTPNSTGATPAYIIDHLTGLGYVRFPVAVNRIWEDAIDRCHTFVLPKGTNFTGDYDDFRMIDESNWVSLSRGNYDAPQGTSVQDNVFDFGNFASRQFDTDTITLINQMWLNKTRPSSVQAFRSNFLGIANINKTTTSQLGGYVVRNHY